jgi:hypothetical protein
MVAKTDEDVLASKVQDEALESAAETVKQKAYAFTLAFCSGLDSCPTEAELDEVLDWRKKKL